MEQCCCELTVCTRLNMFTSSLLVSLALEDQQHHQPIMIRVCMCINQSSKGDRIIPRLEFTVMNREVKCVWASLSSRCCKKHRKSKAKPTITMALMALLLFKLHSKQICTVFHQVRLYVVTRWLKTTYINHGNFKLGNSWSQVLCRSVLEGQNTWIGWWWRWATRGKCLCALHLRYAWMDTWIWNWLLHSSIDQQKTIIAQQQQNWCVKSRDRNAHAFKLRSQC